MFAASPNLYPLPAQATVRVSLWAQGASRAELPRLATLVRELGRACGAAVLSLGGEQESDLVVAVVEGAEAAEAAAEQIGQARARWPGQCWLLLERGLQAAELESLLGAGATDFAPLDSPPAELLVRLRRALGLLRRPANAQAPTHLPQGALQQRLVGRAPAFVSLIQRLPAMAGCGASVLLLGETGTGKEVCAQAIHYGSPRASGPWVAINCAAIPPELVEDELFGHVRGAYTHATGSRRGLVAEAEGGTLFLDEIDSMPLATQAKLLRFVQEKQYRLLGANTVHQADVRVVAASNRDLRRAAESGQFRPDLFYRLSVLTLTLPPLRERAQDIPLLAQHFLEVANRENDRHLAGISSMAMRRLCAHDWPGNVRELRHVMQRAVLLTDSLTLQAEDIELDGQAEPAQADTPPSAEVSFREAKAQAVQVFERNYLEELLQHSEGNISLAARTARKNRRALFELLRRHSIDAAAYRVNRA